MSHLTFGIPDNVTKDMERSAKEKIKKYKSYQPDTEKEIEYLENEILAVSSFIEYHKLQTEREKEVCSWVRCENEYGAELNTSEAMISAAKERLSELENILENCTKRSNKLKKVIDFLENDIDLLENMLKSSPRNKLFEKAGISPII